MVNPNDPVDSHIIEVNKKLFIDAEYVLEYLKRIFDEIRDDANEDIVEDIEYRIDALLERIEFNEWEYK